MSANIRLELLPVETVEPVQANHIDGIDKLAVVVIAHCAAQDVHFGAWCK